MVQDYSCTSMIGAYLPGHKVQMPRCSSHEVKLFVRYRASERKYRHSTPIAIEFYRFTPFDHLLMAARLVYILYRQLAGRGRISENDAEANS